jgi:hypothetical protein
MLARTDIVTVTVVLIHGEGSPKDMSGNLSFSCLSYYRILDRHPIANPIIPIFIIKMIISKRKRIR